MTKGIPFLGMPSSQQGGSLVTLTAHFMTSAVSSDTTRSTHLRLGSLSLRICFLTIASKARSGVKSPVLKGHGVQSACCCGGRERKKGGNKKEKEGRKSRKGKKRTARKEKDKK